MRYAIAITLIVVATASAQTPWIITPGVGMGLAKLGASETSIASASEKMECPVQGEFVDNRAVSLFTSWGGCLATEEGIQVGALFAWAFQAWGPPSKTFIEEEKEDVSIGWAYWMGKGIALRVFIYHDAVGISGVKIFYPERGKVENGIRRIIQKKTSIIF